ncbi:MAG TPA: type II secretion system protein [Gemmatimonadaceae bacterium]|nr:type II secretion system protein [Gemmatimonadaceae bacterium]
MRARGGVTLVELMVVLVMLSVIASVVVLAVRSTPPKRASDESIRVVIAARDSALRTGRVVSVLVPIDGSERAATAFPDGRVEADSALQFDVLSGRPRHAPH